MITPSSNTLSYAMLGMKIKQLQSQEWIAKLESSNNATRTSTNHYSYRKLFKWSLSSKLRTPAGTPREIASAFYQLKIGHGYNKAYLYKLGHTNNDKCRCGSRETVAHLLLSCPEVNIPRKIMRDALNTSLSLPILLHTTKGIELTIQFLQTTKMSRS